MKIEPLVGPHGNLPILIRDDDTNFFTKDSMLQSIYTEAWNKGFKVSLSVIPSQRGFDDVCVPPKLRKTGLFYPITNNERLIEFLREKLRRTAIEVLQHGNSHYVIEGYRGEFGINTLDNEANLNRAISIMNEAFGVRPNFFVPPYDDISYKNLQLVKKHGLVPIYGKDNIHKFFRSPFIPSFLKKRVAKKIYREFGKSAFIVPVMVNIVETNQSNNTSKHMNNGSVDSYDDHDYTVQPAKAQVINTLPLVGLPFKKLISLDSFLDSISKIITVARSNRSKISSLCLINHYHQYFYDWDQSITRTEMFNTWQKLISILASDITYDDEHYLDFGWKTTFLEVYDRILKIKRIIDVSKTGSKIVIQSISESEKIDNLSFHISHGSLEKSPVDSNVTFEKESNIITIKEVLPKSKLIVYVND
jgi:hypothetical protein